MTPDIREFLTATPFHPFSIVMSSGHRYNIPSRDHAGVNPRGSRVVIWFDDGGSVTISALHIAALEKNGR